MAFYPLDRDIQNSDLWQDRPFAKGQAWIDLQLLANWGDGDMLVKGKSVHIERGQVFRSIKFLANRWGWSPKKVRHFLGQLEDAGKVSTKGTAQGTTITIENYPSLGVEGRTKDTTEGAAEGRAEGTQKKNKQKNKIFSPPTVEEVAAYCQDRGNSVDPERFVDFYEAKGWLIGKSKMRDWQASVRTWERHAQDKKAAQQAEFDYGEFGI